MSVARRFLARNVLDFYETSKQQIEIECSSGIMSSNGRLYPDDIRKKFIGSMKESLQFVINDIRDQWHTEIIADNYIKANDQLFEGHFGNAVAAQSRPTYADFVHAEPRACVIKTSKIGVCLDSVISESMNNEDLQKRLKKLQKQILIEVYILNRIRHSNIMHAVVTVVNETSMTLKIVLPRFYQLEQLLGKYRRDKDGEPMNIRIISMILRQLCRALDCLHSAKIVHSDVQPENIYLTRGGTVKLAHFSCARTLSNDTASEQCRTPTGAEEYMCAEKQFNLQVGLTSDEYKCYNTAADIWSLGVLVLHMVSYFPNEKWHRLPRNFALQMGKRGMPFKWMINDMMQLRVRLAESGDEQLKRYLNDTMLNVDPEKRPKAQQILDSYLIKKWCFEELDKDKEYLVRKFIHELDWQNRFKLEADNYNYNACEAKDIPADFYWDDTWRELDQQTFTYRLVITENGRKRGTTIEKQFSHADNSIFETLIDAVDHGYLDAFDVVPVDHHIRNSCFALMRSEKARCLPKSKYELLERVMFDLPSTFCSELRSADLEVNFVKAA